MSADENRGNGSEPVSKEASEEPGTTADEHDGDHDRFLDEELIPILVVGGVVLVLFPEPITSTLGIVLVAVGVSLWLWDLLS